MAQNGAQRVSTVDLLNGVANPTMKLLLRSPLHRMASGSTMLITVTGRKTGARYTTPVNYVRDGSTLTVFSWRQRTWWRNLRGGAPVALRLRGPSLSVEKARELAAQLVLVRISLDAPEV